MFRTRGLYLLIVSVLLLVGITMGAVIVHALEPEAQTALAAGAADAVHGGYAVLTWNDLGMHCYNRNFTDVAVLPPFNTLWAQVIRVGDPPQIITTNVIVTFSFPDNTYSVGKSNFWDTSPYRPVQNAQWLFGLPAPLPDDTGLTGTTLSGTMAVDGDHFIAEGIPLTEFRDSDPTHPYPYQLATVVVRDATTGMVLATNQVVAPVSTEMHCDNCHYDNGPGNGDIATGVVEQNLLTKHDQEEGSDYPPGHEGPLMGRRPILCAECHSSNALGAPGVPDVPSLSNAMHTRHAEYIPDTLDGCYNCHPGPQTRCLRDVMSTRGMDCIDCHGGMLAVSQNPNPWLNEPRCDNPACHGSQYAQDQPLYHFSSEHGGVRCEACHDSTHAIAPSIQPNDALKFVALQGHGGPIDTCTVCHATQPIGPGPHGLTVPHYPGLSFSPDHTALAQPGQRLVYTHSLSNTGNVQDSYWLDWSSSQGWADVTGLAYGITFTLPASVTLLPGDIAVVTVAVTVPNTGTVRGLTDTTLLTATSALSPTLAGHVADVTTVPLVDMAFTPDYSSTHGLGEQAIYVHELRNTGPISDSYSLDWSSSQGWAEVIGSANGITFTLPATVQLEAGQTALLTVTVTVPGTPSAAGLIDVTTVTATSVLEPALVARVTDTTSVPALPPVYRIFLPVVFKGSSN